MIIKKNILLYTFTLGFLCLILIPPHSSTILDTTIVTNQDLFPKVYSTIDKLDNNNTITENNISNYNNFSAIKQSKDLQITLSDLQKQYKELDNRTTDIERIITNISQLGIVKQTDLGASLTELQADTLTSISELYGLISDLQNQYSQLANRTTDLEQIIIDMPQQDTITESELGASITQLQADTSDSLNQIYEDITTSLQTSIDDLNIRVSTLENLQTSIDDLYNRADTIESCVLTAANYGAQSSDMGGIYETLQNCLAGG
jgi:cell division protein FtsB